MERKRIELNFPSQMWYVPPALAFIKELSQQLGFSKKRIEDIQLTIDEICSNAIEHGSETAASGIDLIIILDVNQLDILVRDRGTKQKKYLTAERLDEIHRERVSGQEGGHGIYIAKNLSDQLEIQPNSLGGTDVQVVFRLSTNLPPCG